MEGHPEGCEEHGMFFFVVDLLLKSMVSFFVVVDLLLVDAQIV